MDAKLLMMAAGVGDTDFYPYTVANSCRFNDADNAKLTRTPGVAADSNKIFTLSFWVKRCELGTRQTIFQAQTGTTDDAIRFDSTVVDGIRVYLYDNGYVGQDTTIPIYRDPSAWCNFVWAVNTSEAAEADRSKLWKDNVLQDLTQVNAYGLNDAFTGINQNAIPQSLALGNSDFYLAQVAMLDGVAATPSSFGEDKNGIWVPKDVSGLTFGTNGFYLDFADSSNLGNDVSGNNNDFTSSGLTSSDQMIDTPTNNFYTSGVFNHRISTTKPTMLDGNLQLNLPNSSGAVGLGLPESGKWYWEVQMSTYGNQAFCGITSSTGNVAQVSANSFDMLFATSGTDSYWNFSTGWVGGSNYAGVGVVVGFVYDADARTISVLKADSSVIADVALPDDSQFYLHWAGGGNTIINANFGQNGDFNGTETAQGNADGNGIGDFYYAPEAGALALCTANFPEPTIGPNSTTLPSEVFAAVLYTGNGTAIGSGGKAVTGVGFQPDMVWIKNRDAADQWMCFDSVRGVTKYLSIDGTDIEVTDTESLSTFDADGFTLGNNVAVNTNTEDYVAYCFKITAGFFDIQGASGTGSARTQTHDLGVVPNFIIAKERTVNVNNWPVYCSSLPVADPETDAFLLDTQAAVADSANYWNDTAPTSSVFTVGIAGSTNRSGTDNMIYYLFADVEGFSSIGSYTGNGNVEGPFLYCGFKPAFVLVKKTNAANDWAIWDSARDTYNVSQRTFFADLPNAEYNGNYLCDFLSKGFKLKNDVGISNDNGSTYIYMAFAEQPFKYSNAR